MPTPEPELRPASHADVAAIRELIRQSALGLCTASYPQEQVEAALRGAFGVDTQLIDDGTYFVALANQGANRERAGCELAGCGGWSYRRTLFGGDARPERDAGELDPAADEAARIRAFFVHPRHARLGLASRLLALCESEARARGFRRFALMATLSGVPFYRAHGYVGSERIRYPMGGGLEIEFEPMEKRVA